ncbi:hypothetical protein Hanom_Chr00s017600g01757221 [Helianthus anomalus]
MIRFSTPFQHTHTQTGVHRFNTELTIVTKASAQPRLGANKAPGPTNRSECASRH